MLEELKASRFNTTIDGAQEAVADVAPMASISGDDDVKAATEPRTTEIDIKALQRAALDHFDQVSGDILHSVQSIEASEENSKDQSENTALCSALLGCILKSGEYDAWARSLLRGVARRLHLSADDVAGIEQGVAQIVAHGNEGISGEKERSAAEQANQTSRRWKLGLAGVAGGALVGITGGLAAPLVASSIGGLLGGLGGITALAGNAVITGSLFGAYGASLSRKMTSRYTQDVTDFEFVPIQVSSSMPVVICISGWLTDKEEVTEPWKNMFTSTQDVYALQWEMEALLNLGNALVAFVKDSAFSYAKTEIIKRTALATLYSALWPIGVLKAGKLVDNPWNIAFVRAQKAGQVLADVLINRGHGKRPVTLIGYSLGARTIYTALLELARRRAFGIVEEVYLFGTPAPNRLNEWQAIRDIVTGRVVNVYSERDYILAYLYRSASIQLGVAGLEPIEGITGLENVNADSLDGHLRYRWEVATIYANQLSPKQ